MSESNPTHLPFLSICTPVFNRGKVALDTFRQLEDATINSFELLVWNNGSSPSTTRMLIDWYAASDNLSTALVLFPQNIGKGRAINSLVRLSRGEIIVSLDADVLLPKSWDQDLLAVVDSGEADVIAPCYERGLILPPWGPGDGSANDPSIWQGFEVLPTHFVAGPVFLMKRSTWDQIGGYIEHRVYSGDDDDFCRRALNLGLKVRYTPRVVAAHLGENDSPEYISRKWEAHRTQGTIPSDWFDGVFEE